MDKVEFVIAEEKREYYIKKLISAKKSTDYEKEFYDSVFEDIRNYQTVLKIDNINGCEIVNAVDVLEFNKHIYKQHIDEMIINRIMGIQIFNANPKYIPNSFIDEILSYNAELRKDIIQDCQSDISRLLFDKNKRESFWKFFNKLHKYEKDMVSKTPKEIAEQLYKDNVKIPITLSYNSLLYLISALKEVI